MVRSSRSLPRRRTISSAAMIIPGVQKPHCRAWCSRNASCIGCNGPSGSARPSMVVTCAPSHWSASVVQDFTAMPSRCTTQAPHCDVSQPTCVPVSRRFSRRNCTSKVRASISAETGLPLTVIDTTGIAALPFLEQNPVFRAVFERCRRPGPKIEPIWSPLRLGTDLTLNPSRPAGQGIPRGKCA